MTMTTKYQLSALILTLMPFASAHAQQVPLPKTAAEVPAPPAGTAMSKAYVQTVGRMAYVWGYALVHSDSPT